MISRTELAGLLCGLVGLTFALCLLFLFVQAWSV